MLAATLFSGMTKETKQPMSQHHVPKRESINYATETRSRLQPAARHLVANLKTTGLERHVGKRRGYGFLSLFKFTEHCT